jgi:ComF family protein
MLARLERLVAALVAPSVCVACEERIREGIAFCAACAATIEAERAAETGSRVAVGTYGGALAEAIQRLKYRGCPWIATPLGDLLAQRCLDEGCAPDLVVPVPLHRSRLFDRGYNQAALLASRLARVGYRVDALALERVRDTTSQATLDRERRLENLVGAFRARHDLAGKVVMLLDDVSTTGGTLRACGDAVRAAGGRVSTSAVLAWVDQEDDGPPHDASNLATSSANPAPRSRDAT